MKKVILSAIALLCLVPLAPPADAQVVVRLGHGHRRYYHHRHYYHHYHHRY